MRLALALALATLLAACAGDPEGNSRVNNTPMAPPVAQTGNAPIEIPKVVCPPTNPFCDQAQTRTPQNGGKTSCGEVPINLTPSGVNVMIAIDGSPSMVTHWSEIQTAVRSLHASNPAAQFGLHVFWGEAADVFSGSTTNMSNNICGAIHNDLLEVGSHSEQELSSFLGDKPPGQWFIEGQIEISPVIEPLNYYLTNAAKLADPTRTNYLVLLSDGNDNCFGSFFSTKSDKLLAYQKVAAELYRKGVRVIPIGFDAPAMAPDANPFGFPVSGAVKPDTDVDVLGTLLQYGGAALPEVPKADDPQKLASAVQQVGQRISNCRFDLPAVLDPNANVSPFELSFAINGQDIARDRLNQNGWNFVDGGTSQVELFGDGCVAIQSGQPIQVGKSCASNVCGTASVKVETKPRAVLLVLDSSASRIECADGSVGCLSDPNTTPDRPLTFWETVQHAVGVTLTAPINDDVEFGLQFFPSKTAEALSCAVEANAEVPPSQGTEIGMMKAMLEKLPFGLSPVVEVIESIAANPGRLADPSV
ncbi:MAG TPA: vWA domain-containing protein, partial [Polyangiales bacterium]|nr:vWA domain-containing protein [Polyangiales bacterium]